MQYASKISNLEPRKLIEEISKIINKYIQQGNDPDKTLLIIELSTIQDAENSIKRLS